MRRAGTRGIAGSIWLALLLATVAPVHAQTESPPPPEEQNQSLQETLTATQVLVRADEVVYEDELGVVVATGNVELSQSDRVLLADTINYNTKTDLVTASGNIALLEPSGDVVFAEYMELTGDLKEAFMRDVGLLMADRTTRVAAASGVRTNGNRSVLNRAVFSPCQLCKNDPDRAPLWQIKARRAVHDQEEKEVRYRDAWIEMFGIPVIYTPYFEHPDPTVTKKSGLLSPTYGSGDTLGFFVQVPYFWNIAPEQDLTLSPRFFRSEKPLLESEYRLLLPDGSLNVRGSGTFGDRERNNGTIDKNAFRGHIDAVGRYDIDRRWRSGFDVRRSTDDTFSRLYDVDIPDSFDSTLTSQIFAEGFEGRNYLGANGFAYQTQRESVENKELPVVMPFLSNNYVGEPFKNSGFATMDSSLLALTRIEGRDYQRVSFKPGYTQPFTTDSGMRLNFRANVQADGYLTNDFDPDQPNEANPSGGIGGDTTGRVFPRAAVEWRYPWIGELGEMQQIVEPIAQGVLQPTWGNSDAIPNEDSLDFEFDDTNLFSLNRFPGIDRVDTGPRADYGLNYRLIDSSIGYSEFFVGQSYRFDTDKDLFPEGSGVEDNLSDFVGRVTTSPIPEIALSYRFRLDKDSLDVRRNEVSFAGGVPAFNIRLNYLDIDPLDEEDSFGKREEIALTARSRLTQFWTVTGIFQRDLEANDTLRYGAGGVYSDECFTMVASWTRRNFRDRDLEPEDVFLFQLSFKHLGEFGFN